MLNPPPLYPTAFRPGTRRTIAIRVGKYIHDEDGCVYDWPASYLALKDLMFDNNMMLFAPAIPWPETAILMGDKLLWSNKARKFNGLSIRKSRKSLRICLSAGWPGMLESDDGMQSLRSMFTTCGVGDHGSPAALGQTLIRKLYDKTQGKLARPPWQCWLDLTHNLIGGRSELWRPGLWRHVHEEDINSAYPTALASVPSGNCHYLDASNDPVWSHSTHTYPWFFGSYRWRMLGGMGRAVGTPVLGVRKSSGDVVYPSSPDGWHHGWYTKEEVYAAMIYGYEMQWLEGWGWTKLSNAFEPWIKEIERLRESSTGLVRQWIKLMAVASIGRFGMDAANYKVLLYPSGAPRTTQSEESQYICDCETGDILYVIDKVENRRNPELLAHIAIKVHADVRLKTLFRSMPYAREKRLIATNFDAIYYVGDPIHQDYSEDFGAWKHAELWNASFPARRWMLTDDLRKTPGLVH